MATEKKVEITVEQRTEFFKQHIGFRIKSATEDMEKALKGINENPSYYLSWNSSSLYKSHLEQAFWSSFAEKIKDWDLEQIFGLIVSEIHTIEGQIMRTCLMNSTSIMSNACGLWEFETRQKIVRDLNDYKNI